MLTLPHTIDNQLGERLTFKEIIVEDGIEKVLVEGVVAPGSGPAMHTHWQQDEYISIIAGGMGYQTLGQEPQYAGPGEGVLFSKGTPHRFWNDGEEELRLEGWISPPHSVIYFLSALYAAQAKSGNPQPELFDGAYLVTRYRSEYDINEVPAFVKRVIMPATVFVGRLLGKYRHFADAPAPLPG